jgi:hypothetical protein
MDGINDAVRVNFYNTWATGRVFDPYDCSKTDPASKTGNLTKYCLESRYQSCAVLTHCPFTEEGGSASTCAPVDQLKLANFFACAEGVPYTTKHKTSFDDVIPCAKTHGLDVDKIATCFDTSNVGYDSSPVKVIDMISNITNKASPTVQYFPDIRVKGVQAKGTLLAVRDSHRFRLSLHFSSCHCICVAVRLFVLSFQHRSLRPASKCRLPFGAPFGVLSIGAELAMPTNAE